MKWPWAKQRSRPEPDCQSAKEWAASAVDVYRRNPIRFRFDVEGSLIRVWGKVRQINDDGTVYLWRDINRFDPRIMCQFQTLRMAADLDRGQEIVVEGELLEVRCVKRGDRHFYDLRLVNCRWEEMP